MYDEDFDEDYDSRDSALFAGVGVMVIVLVTILVVIGMALGMTFKAFLVNPLVLGVRKFFLKSYDCPGNFVHFGDGYKYNYIKNVGTLFLKDLFTMLWSLLFIVPGIIKSYEYRMIPYLIAENPDMTYQEAFAKSKDMMMGNKWNAFVLDLSFLGWFALNALTCGILGIFYVNPYYYATDANLYRALKMGGDTGYRSDEYARLVAAQQAAAANTTQQAAPTADATTQTQESEQAAPTTEPMQTASSDTSQVAQETQTTTTQETSAEVDSGNESSAETDSKEE
ncbi:MAG: DUF975 family protein [Lachnospiraceae bacterium]|nr:DUF975 family protein [Lachnospiraceae bacterium]